MRDRSEHVFEQNDSTFPVLQRRPPTPPAPHPTRSSRDRKATNSPGTRMVDWSSVERHRPIWVRGLTASDLDRRQEQARLLNHGQQILLESKLGILDLQERRTVKDISRERENVLTMMRSFQTSSPRLSSLENAIPTKDSTGTSERRRRTISLDDTQREEESSSSGESPEVEHRAVPVVTLPEVHLPRLRPRPRIPKSNSRRRYSANDALVQSIERFNAYRASLGRFPSEETVQEVSDKELDPDLEEPAKNNINDFPIRNLWTRNQSEPFPAKPEQTDLPFDHADIAESDENIVNDKTNAVRSKKETVPKPSTAPYMSRSLSVLAPDILPFIRSQSSQGKRPHIKPNSHGHYADLGDDDDDDDDEGEVSIVVPFKHTTEHALRTARRQSLAVKPATFRGLAARRNSSPDILTSTSTSTTRHNPNRLSASSSKHRSTRSTSTSPRGRKADDNGKLNSKIRDFLQRTDTFIESTRDQLPQIGQTE